ncbi:hypothetical protein A2U01_0098948, partial [Trifolium medium]|nr:hypothetical protein [Trifolium medium]
PMTRTQWRRFQRRKKLASQNVNAGGNATVVQKVEIARRPAKERLTPVVEMAEPEKEKAEKGKEVEGENEEDYMDDD